MNKDIFVKLLQQRQYKAVRSILDVMNEVDIASLLSELDDKELALAFRLIPKDKAAEVFANMDSSMQTYLVEMFSEKELKELLDDLYMDDTVDLSRGAAGKSGQPHPRYCQHVRPGAHQPAPELSGRQCRKHYDHRIRRHPGKYDCRTVYGTYQGNRDPQRNDLYLLCD